MSVQIKQTTTIRHEYRVGNPGGLAELKEAISMAESQAKEKKISSGSIGYAADSQGVFLHFNEQLAPVTAPRVAPENDVIRQ